jgi:peroxiredoxin Q/BCP
MLKAQTRAPDFDLQDDQGQNVSLSLLVQAGPLILYFYPADFTPGCTSEACTIRDIHDDMVAVGLQVVGVSPQDPASHARFRQQHDLPFTLLSDPAKKVIKMYDVDGPLGFGVRRATYLIGQEQIIHDAMLADIVISRHKDFIQKASRLFAGNG